MRTGTCGQQRIIPGDSFLSLCLEALEARDADYTQMRIMKIIYNIACGQLADCKY